MKWDLWTSLYGYSSHAGHILVVTLHLHKAGLTVQQTSEMSHWVRFVPFMFFSARIIDFHQPTGPGDTHPRLFDWVKQYFTQSNRSSRLPPRLIHTQLPPLYLQHQGIQQHHLPCGFVTHGVAASVQDQWAMSFSYWRILTGLSWTVVTSKWMRNSFLYSDL